MNVECDITAYLLQKFHCRLAFLFLTYFVRPFFMWRGLCGPWTDGFIEFNFGQFIKSDSDFDIHKNVK